MTEEWDWPQRTAPRARPTIDGRIIRERVILRQDPRRTGWSSPKFTKAVDVFFSATMVGLKIAIAIPLTLIVLGAIWLMMAMFKAG